MNYNITSYIIYALALIFVIVRVGHLLFKNGRPFIINCFHGDAVTADAINRILLIGYYLVNIGYSVVVLKIWHSIISAEEMLEILSHKIGVIVLILGAMHMCNVFLLMQGGKMFHQDHHKNANQ